MSARKVEATRRQWNDQLLFYSELLVWVGERHRRWSTETRQLCSNANYIALPAQSNSCVVQSTKPIGSCVQNTEDLYLPCHLTMLLAYVGTGSLES